MPGTTTPCADVESLRDTVTMYGDPLVVTKTYGKGETVAFLTTAGKQWNDWAGGGWPRPPGPSSCSTCNAT